jgi:hypothetical protein
VIHDADEAIRTKLSDGKIISEINSQPVTKRNNRAKASPEWLSKRLPSYTRRSVLNDDTFGCGVRQTAQDSTGVSSSLMCISIEVVSNYLNPNTMKY